MLQRSSSFGILAKAVQNYYQTEKWRADLFQGGIKDISQDHSIMDLSTVQAHKNCVKDPKKWAQRSVLTD